MSQTVFVGMSGGVDSSLTAVLLKEQGYEVVGVFMKNWSQDLPGHHCPWREDFQDAKRVAVQLDIDLRLYDFQAQYRQKVVNYMIGEYQAGRTPNPDIMCNQEVKFKLFMDVAREEGADMIATGHYARIQDGRLLTGVDANKDQSYFLYRVTEAALRGSLMPIGDYEKTKVREMAAERGLVTATKKDSQGICFIGTIGIKDFLLAELGPQRPGLIVDQHGRTIGEHDGAIFYTIGQRHGLKVGGGMPIYVVGKSMETNIVNVTTDLQDDRLWHKSLKLTDMHFINGESLQGVPLAVRTRYRAPLVQVRGLHRVSDRVWHLELDEEVRAITPGQSAVLYAGEWCVGGGIVTSSSVSS